MDTPEPGRPPLWAEPGPYQLFGQATEGRERRLREEGEGPATRQAQAWAAGGGNPGGSKCAVLL